MMAETKVILDPLCREQGVYFLTGVEALARASLVSGTQYFATYPGSPITGVSEVMLEAMKVIPGLHAEFSLNESIAVHGAAGASWTGVRALVTMKHVGIHVSSDPIAYLGYTGTVGGLVLAVGTDPGATCSTGEFDIRHFNDAFHWVMLEPSDVGEVYEYTLKAFEISEKRQIPVFLIMPAELCNQYGTLFSERLPEIGVAPYFTKSEKYINNGPTAVRHHLELLAKLNDLSAEADTYITQSNPGAADIGIITTGCNYPAVNEALEILGKTGVAVIKLGMTYPLPELGLIRRCSGFKKLLIIEELDGYLTERLLALAQRNALPIPIKTIQEDLLGAGILTMERLLRYLSREFKVVYQEPPAKPQVHIPERPGTFCPGCPHRGILYTLQQICGPKDVYGGDIGCSSLPPYYSDWLTCMGSGLGIAHGVATTVKKDSKVYASMGDSTFFHCGIPIIVNVLQQKTDITILILDNRWTAMTGHQPLPHTQHPTQISIYNIIKALGASRLWEVGAYQLSLFKEILVQTREITGVKIIIVKGECRLKYAETLRRNLRRNPISCKIVEDLCHQCGECYKVLGCPAIMYENDCYRIDQEICGKCGICAQICPNKSISMIEYAEDEHEI